MCVYSGTNHLKIRKNAKSQSYATHKNMRRRPRQWMCQMGNAKPADFVSFAVCLLCKNGHKELANSIFATTHNSRTKLWQKMEELGEREKQLDQSESEKCVHEFGVDVMVRVSVCVCVRLCESGVTKHEAQKIYAMLAVPFYWIWIYLYECVCSYRVCTINFQTVINSEYLFLFAECIVGVPPTKTNACGTWHFSAARSLCSRFISWFYFFCNGCSSWRRSTPPPSTTATIATTLAPSPFVCVWHTVCHIHFEIQFLFYVHWFHDNWWKLYSTSSNEWVNFLAYFDQSNWQQQQRRRSSSSSSGAEAAKICTKYLAQEATQVVTCGIYTWHVSFIRPIAFTTFSFTTSSSFSALLVQSFYYISIFGWKSLSSCTFYSLWFLCCIFFCFHNEEEFGLAFLVIIALNGPISKSQRQKNVCIGIAIFFFVRFLHARVSWVYFFWKAIAKEVMAQLHCEFNRRVLCLSTQNNQQERQASERKSIQSMLCSMYAVKYVFTFKVVYLLISRSSRHLICHLATRHTHSHFTN